jgi:truncated hemoglobin YjbI
MLSLRMIQIHFLQAMSGEHATLWLNVMKEEMESMAKNQVWESG